ncbi:hypothetical protein BKA58DRAFT_393615 [Alternaria rosae]|uniref:uncharacterized protein n=1 Tax=Alternaria rosae TaxID=1187941 RepID=UPI001E8D89A0|nr:uncharacterized protein BKA58DRAFT_393615 [Alternaria rosae]KAH6859113.1 hypothetical protein BKA58DRAFT_393615 [Alternaria rosae]
MTTYDPRKGERSTQMRTARQDVDMVDAPPRESPWPPRLRPRKLEYRHGSVETTQDVCKNDNHVQTMEMYDHSHTSHATCETTQIWQSVHTRQDPHASVISANGTPNRFARDHGDDDDHHRYKREQDRTRNVEDRSIALQESHQLFEIHPAAATEWRAKAEKDFAERNSHLDAHTQSTSQIHKLLEDELQNKAKDLASVLEQTKLKEKQLDNEREQWIAEKQQQESDRQQWEFERQEWKSKENQYAADIRDLTFQWKKAAKQLNGLIAQGQGHHQVTDNYLCGLITQLRYKIRDFGIQYFSEKLPKRPKFEQNWVWKEHMASTTRDESYADFVNYPETRPSVIQAFLWRVIVHEVFSKFRWAGPASSPITNLFRELESCLHGGGSSPADAEATKKLHTWRATTVSLLLDSMGQLKRRQADNELQRWQVELHNDMHRNLRLLKPKDQKGCKQDFLDIIDGAVKIDEEISRQVSRVEWTFGFGNGMQTLDLATMELRKGEPFIPNSEVTLVISPGVIKQGKSTGEGFESSVCLLKMEVSCEKSVSRL